MQSGAPWAARARDVPGAVMNYLEPGGSHRNPVWANLDLMGAYRVPFAGRASVSLEARLLNVFNNQTRLSTDSQQFLDVRSLPVPPYIAPYQQPNPFFTTGNAFAPPRRLHMAAVFAFWRRVFVAPSTEVFGPRAACARRPRPDSQQLC